MPQVSLLLLPSWVIVRGKYAISRTGRFEKGWGVGGED